MRQMDWEVLDDGAANILGAQHPGTGTAPPHRRTATAEPRAFMPVAVHP